MIKTEDKLMMMPGPVEVPHRVLMAMAKPMINHRGKEFSAVYDDCQRISATLFNTAQENVSVISGSGTAGMEAAVGCLNNKDDKILAIENGKFGQRFKKLAGKYGTVVPLEFEWGKSVDLAAVEEKLAAGDIKTITMIHNESSTAIRNPAPEVGALAKKYGAYFILDVVSSLGGDDIRIDDWNVDIAVTGSQKCIAAPPGISVVAANERALAEMENIKTRPYYLDLVAYHKSASKDLKETPYTPAVSLFFALQEALKIIEEEGLANRIERHYLMTKAVRDSVTAIGVEMFPQLNDVSAYSNTVSAMKAPAGVDGEAIKKALNKRGVIITGGQDDLKGKIFRIGSMGATTPTNIMTTMAELEQVLYEMGVTEETGAVMDIAGKTMAKLYE
ncbi:pyridoxal-phosphate-dependent aminotransferase family protein [Methanimicrococcus blatticola]|uniref:Aspartate aminotransferase-like enzyme n=1 Tax=Methanimicrococcus blatticola TaxID=91560 RepID=A0A484F661_9EURY|nr:alanine--glyoxylate aminotransferase family protein [Methanimicrococcus blatticola]TDQ71249.1 aspartate aminotransferase-like enzyme [Methanimicrococcus blatticola]